MKPHGILLFVLSVFALIGLCWFFFPSGGVQVGGVKLRFPSYQSYIEGDESHVKGVDVDSVLISAKKSYDLLQESRDTLSFFHDFLSSNPGRVYVPEGENDFFDTVFEAMEQAARDGRTVRIIHYGDSQLEMDRISSVLRQELQERFGGSGPGMTPMMRKIHSVSVSQSARGGITRYSLVADSLSHWTSSHRYGIMTQFAGMVGGGSYSFRRADNRYVQDRAKHISKVSVLLGHNSPGFSLSLKCDTLKAMTEVLDSSINGPVVVSWKLPVDVAKGTISFSGNAEIYGIMLDGEPGVTVDNVALRGCSGTVFTGIDSTLMKESFKATETKMIILQFGGNAMPGIGSSKSISSYVNKMDIQFEYFKKVAPDARLLFVGPADMSKSVDGHLISWPRLSELNDSLRVHCLENGVAFWDTFNVMGGPGSMREWVNHNPPLAGPDYIHFTTKGAEEIGRYLSRSLLVYDDFRRIRDKLSDAVVNEYLDTVRTQTDTLAR